MWKNFTIIWKNIQNSEKNLEKRDFMIITDIFREHDYITFIPDQAGVSILISANIYLWNYFL